MAIISINYSEGNKEDLKYKGVKLKLQNETERFFASGDFVKDWFNLKKFLTTENIYSKEVVMQSSSVDHFIMDGAPYTSAYLHFKDDEIPYLRYMPEYPKEDSTKEEMMKFLLDTKELTDGTEFFVLDGTKPTWEELKEICK